MRSSTLSVLVVVNLLLSGCGHGADGPRGSDSPGASGSSSLGGAPVATAGSAGSAPATSAGTSAGGSPVTGTGGSGAAPEPCGPAWAAGTPYQAGDIVLYQGSYYIAEHENPGYDPVISHYFWEPYACGSDGGAGGTSGAAGGGGPGPTGESSFDDIVSEALFNQMFPDRNGFYTYQGLVAASRYYPAFAGRGSEEQRKREAAAFLANVARETGKLIYIEQIEKDVYCQPSNSCPCAPGKQYFGRGPIQISWNYNYCSAGAALGHDLLTQPELVAQNATIAWETGLWFWMTQTGAGIHTPHDGIVDGHGFGETIRSINGAQECNGAWSEAVTARVDFYQQFCALLGVSPGNGVRC